MYIIIINNLLVCICELKNYTYFFHLFFYAKRRGYFFPDNFLMLALFTGTVLL